MLSKIKNSAKLLLATALDVTGVLSALSVMQHRNKCIVLTYHRVLEATDRPRTSSHPGIIVSRKSFEIQMQFVADHLCPLTLDSFISHLEEGKPFPPKSCLITFDDGWVDNYQVAFPILLACRIPATIFLPVDYVSAETMFWQEELFMRLCSERELHDAPLIRKREVRAHISKLKQGDTNLIRSELDAARLTSADQQFHGHYNRYLSWAQVCEMKRGGISFGSHACSHQILCKLSEDEQIRELTESKKIIEKHLNQSVSALAYPNGDFDDCVVRNSKAAGYTIAFSTIHGFCKATSDNFAIPRVNIHEQNTMTTAMFRCTLLGLF